MAKIPKSLLLILLLGFGLRLINLGQSFWLDEASQGVMSARAVSSIWASKTAEYQPPLFYLLAHYWLAFGRSEFWLRLPSVAFGVAAIYLIYLLVRDLHLQPKFSLGPFSVSPEILAALFLAVNPYHIYYSQEFRSYSLLCFLGTWAMWWTYRGRFKSLVLLNTLLVYTHYSALFLILTELVYVAVYHQTGLKTFLWSCFWVVLLCLPWLPQLLRQLSVGFNLDQYLPGWTGILSLSPLKALPVTLFKLVAGPISLVSVPLYLLYVAFVIVVVFLAFRVTRQRQKFLFTWIFVPVILMILTSFVFPQNQPFRVIYVIPALVIVFVQACIRYPKLFTTFFIYIFIFGNLMYFTRPRLQRENWRQAIAFLTDSAGPDTAIVVKYNDKFSPFYWYAPGLKVFAVVPRFPARGPDVAKLSAFAADPGINNVYLLDYLTGLTDPSGEVENVLKDMGFSLDRTYDFPGVGIIRKLTKS